MEKVNSFIDIANKKVSKELMSEFTIKEYMTWIKYVESAYIDNANIVIDIPSEFCKQTIESKYLHIIEYLYRKEIKFNILKLNVITEPETDIEEIIKIREASETKMITDRVRQNSDDFELRLKEQLKEIFRIIDLAVSRGEYEACVVRKVEDKLVETLWSRVENILVESGYKTKLKKVSNNIVLYISWDI